MRGAVLLFSSILWLSIPGFGQADIAVDDLAHHPIALDFPSGGQLEMHIRSGEIHIEGSDDGKISVRASGKRGGDSTDIRARFERSGDFGRLRVTGGPSSDVTITVQRLSAADIIDILHQLEALPNVREVAEI